MGLTFIFLNTGVIITNAPRNLRKSRPNPFSSGSRPEWHSSCRLGGRRHILYTVLFLPLQEATLPVNTADAVLRSARACGTSQAFVVARIRAIHWLQPAL